MNKNLKIALILLSTIALSILGVRQCINEYGDPQRILFKALGVIDENDRSSQEGLIYQLDDEGDYIRLKGKKLFRDPQDIAKDYYVYITNSTFQNSEKLTRTDSDDSPDFSMGGGLSRMIGNRYTEVQFTVLDLRNGGNSIALSSGVIEEIEEDMQFALMIEVLEEQIDGIFKKMYPEDIFLLDKIKSEISENITIYTNIPNHLETDHRWRYDVKFGQQYGLFISRYISPISGKHFYMLDIARYYVNL